MRRWFLSYTSQDFALIQSLKAALQRREAGSHVFLAPESMRAGGFWQQQLADEIAQSNAFVFLVGETGIGPWQVMEYYEALDRRAKEPDYPLIVILSEITSKRAAPGLPFVRQLHWVLTEDPASEATVGKLIDAASGPVTRPNELWRYTRPYRGLEAMTEANSDFFFGRERKTIEVIEALASERGKLPILLGNSGVGKSSLAQAGVLATLLRQAWPEQAKDAGPWPAVFDRSRHWCFLTLRPGADPLKALVDVFLERWQFKAGAERIKEQNQLTRLLLDGNATLSSLLDETEKRHRELAQPSPPAFLLYIDQGEELYVRAERQQRYRFSKIIATGLADTRLRALMTMRADFFGELQKDESLYGVHRLVNVPPLREAELYEIVGNPAKSLSARFQTDTLAADIAKRTAEESTEDAGALPLLSYLLDDMWSEMVQRSDGVLRLPMPAIDLGRVLVERANKFVAEHPGIKAEEALRRIFTLKLATVREDGEPTRRRATRSEFTDDEWRLVSELAGHPNRLVVTVTPDSAATPLVRGSAKSDSNDIAAFRETYAEVAHEAIFRRWDKLRDWIAAEREFLAWKTSLDAPRRAWRDTPENEKNDALLMGAALTQAQSWLSKRRNDLSSTDIDFIDQSESRERRTRIRARHVRSLVYVLLVSIIVGLIGWINQSRLNEQIHWHVTMRPYMLAKFRPYVLSNEKEQTLKSGVAFKECAQDCPEMIVVPAGEFMMGSPQQDERPQHKVRISRPFAVSKFEVTFTEWDACVAVGGCPRTNDAGLGRETRPVIYVTWSDAQQYVAWLSTMTGKPYRLLSEAEWEYAARGGTDIVYSWSNSLGSGNANCVRCGSEWDGMRTAPVGSFAPNAFGLHDVHGNVWEWVQDCYHENYEGTPPLDGSAWTEGASCDRRVVRGGSWLSGPSYIRSASRYRYYPDIRNPYVGIRVARTLSPSLPTQYATPAQEEEITYRTARGNIDLLLAYLKDCKICAFTAAVREEITYSTAGDIDRVLNYLQECQICEFKTVAQEYIAELKQQEQTTYYAARGNTDLLLSYLQNCKICTFAAAAREEITRLSRTQEPPAMFVGYLNRDLYGGDYQRLDSVELSNCESACRSDSACVAYTFNRWSRTCFLKSSITFLRIEPRATTGVRGDLRPPSESNDPIVMRRYPSRVFPGDGYAQQTASFESCVSRCERAATCVAYSFLKPIRRCTLFGETGEYFPDNRVDSGLKVQPAK